MDKIFDFFNWLFGRNLNLGGIKLDAKDLEFLSSLASASLDTRVDFVKKIQSRQNEIKAGFEGAVRELERKYWIQYEPLFRQINNIVNTGSDGESPGIPRFWLSALKKHPEIAPTISPRDEGALAHLVDLQVEFLEGANFRLSFKFSPNVYFSNETLKKTYFYRTDKSTGLTVHHYAEGTKIDWLPGRDLTQMTKKKKITRKHGDGEEIAIVEETFVVDSFFDFFSPAEAPTDEKAAADEKETLDDSAEWLRVIDFKNGEAIKGQVIPRAVDFYTGKAGQEFEEVRHGDDDEFDPGYDEEGEEGE